MAKKYIQIYKEFEGDAVGLNAQLIHQLNFLPFGQLFSSGLIKIGMPFILMHNAKLASSVNNKFPKAHMALAKINFYDRFRHEADMSNIEILTAAKTGGALTIMLPDQLIQRDDLIFPHMVISSPLPIPGAK